MRVCKYMHLYLHMYKHVYVYVCVFIQVSPKRCPDKSRFSSSVVGAVECSQVMLYVSVGLNLSKGKPCRGMNVKPFYGSQPICLNHSLSVQLRACAQHMRERRSKLGKKESITEA